jgi:hypothetical protein
MKTISYVLGMAALLAPGLAMAQYGGGTLPEPLSFGGVPSQGEQFSGDLSFRLTFLDEDANGVAVDQNANAFLLDIRGRVSPFLQITATLPVGDFDNETTIAGVLVINQNETNLANPAIGALFTPAAQGPVRFAAGFSVGIPVTDVNDVGLVGGLAANSMNASLFTPELLSLRPEGRIAFDSGLVSLQGLLGLDIGIDANEDNGDNDALLLRTGLSLAVRPADVFALVGEFTFVDNLENDNDGVAELHLGGRGMLRSGSGGTFQPGFEVFLPVDGDDDNNDINDFFDVGIALSLRGSF